jgi:thiamine-phosphate pyrophosphorylase
MFMSIRIDVRLYAIIDESLLEGRSPALLAEELVNSGVTVLQYRAKHLASDEFVHRVRLVLDAIRLSRVPLIINDRVEVAVASGAQGVHVGKNDVAVSEARRVLGMDGIIGATVRNAEDLSRAEGQGADYVGAGSVFPSETKPGVRVIGLEGLTEIKARAKIPVVAIGGLTSDNAGEVLSTGVDGLAFVSAILGSDEPGKAAGRLRALIDQARKG